MSYNEKLRTGQSRLQLLIPILLSLFLTAQVVAQETDAAAQEKALSVEDLQSLESSLSDLKSLAPQLRVQLRTLRSQVGFDPREIHQIERGMSQSQKDLERLIAMTKRDAFNGMRAHFLADDLRRKSEGLLDSLSYVETRIQQLNKDSTDRQADTDRQQQDEALLNLLGRYSKLLNNSVSLLKSKGI